MTILNATEAASKLYSLIDETANTHQPIFIIGKGGNGVLVSEEDWNAISKTLHLMSILGMGKSIREGMGIPVLDCSEELDW